MFLKQGLNPRKDYQIVSARTWREMRNRGFITSPQIPLFVVDSSLPAPVLQKLVQKEGKYIDIFPQKFEVTWLPLETPKPQTTTLLLSTLITVQQLLYYIASEIDIDLNSMELLMDRNSPFKFDSSSTRTLESLNTHSFVIKYENNSRFKYIDPPGSYDVEMEDSP